MEVNDCEEATSVRREGWEGKVDDKNDILFEKKHWSTVDQFFTSSPQPYLVIVAGGNQENLNNKIIIVLLILLK